MYEWNDPTSVGQIRVQATKQAVPSWTNKQYVQGSSSKGMRGEQQSGGNGVPITGALVWYVLSSSLPV